MLMIYNRIKIQVIVVVHSENFDHLILDTSSVVYMYGPCAAYEKKN